MAATQNNTVKIKVAKLLRDLAKAADQDAKKGIRKNLRRLGHKGGLNKKLTGPRPKKGKAITAQPKPKPARKTAAQNREQGRKELEDYNAKKAAEASTQ